jgi:hypothetical protein
MNKDTGGQAFPIVGRKYDVVEAGMNLRDYFAAKAMQGFNANPDCTDLTNETVAEWSYSLADAMLEARNK